MGWSHSFVQAIANKQRFAQVIEAEIAARALYGVLALTIAMNNTLDPLGGDAVGVVHHLDQNEFPMPTVSFVHVQNGMGGGAGTGEGVKNNVSIFRYCLNYTFN